MFPFLRNLIKILIILMLIFEIYNSFNINKKNRGKKKLNSFFYLNFKKKLNFSSRVILIIPYIFVLNILNLKPISVDRE